MRHPRPLIVPTLLVLLTACPSATLLPDDQRNQVTKDFEGKILFLKPATYVLPFFSVPESRLVSPLPPDSIHLLDDTKGEPILPGEPEAILKAGTRVRVEKLEFPTGFVVTKRPLYSPRTSPWLYLNVEGRPKGKATIVVLRPGIRSREEFVAAMDQLFHEEDPSAELSRIPPEFRAAIDEKRLVAGMDGESVLLAWGRPEKIHQEFVDGVKVESWTWPLGKRSTTLRDGKLADAVPPLVKHGAP